MQGKEWSGGQMRAVLCIYGAVHDTLGEMPSRFGAQWECLAMDEDIWTAEIMRVDDEIIGEENIKKINKLMG